MAQTDSKNINEFSRLEKEALKKTSLDIIKSDLERSLKEIRQKSMTDVERRISVIRPLA